MNTIFKKIAGVLLIETVIALFIMMLVLLIGCDSEAILAGELSFLFINGFIVAIYLIYLIAKKFF